MAFTDLHEEIEGMFAQLSGVPEYGTNQGLDKMRIVWTAETHALWRKQNPERIREYHRRYLAKMTPAERHEYQQKANERKRAWRAANPERDREYGRAWWAALPPEKRAEKNAKRRKPPREKQSPEERKRKRTEKSRRWRAAFKARDPEGWKAYQARSWQRYKETLRVRKGADDRHVVNGTAQVSAEPDASQTAVRFVRG